VNGDAPPPASLGDGIHLIPVPLPFRSPSWVNCYAIETRDGVALIDCGCDWERGRAALDAGLTVSGLAGAPVHTLIVSHLHPDHVGMADRVVAEHQARFVMHRRAARHVGRYNDTPGFVARNLDLAARHGVPDHHVHTLADVGPRPDYMPPISAPDTVVDDGDQLDLGGDRHLEVLHTPGHDPSHICLRDSLSGVIFSGDHVLPRISPVIMFDEEYDDVLADYLGSLKRLLTVPIGLTYPAHGTIIERGAARVEQIVLHHERRLAQMVSRADAAAATAWEMMEAIFRPHLSPADQRLAFRETVAHLEHLRLRKRLAAHDRDGVVWYRRRPGAP
jgi:glyoxylase-like metal-dependent hydrolase (beta-lactamase superfamily II)